MNLRTYENNSPLARCLTCVVKALHNALQHNTYASAALNLVQASLDLYPQPLITHGRSLQPYLCIQHPVGMLHMSENNNDYQDRMVNLGTFPTASRILSAQAQNLSSFHPSPSTSASIRLPPIGGRSSRLVRYIIKHAIVLSKALNPVNIPARLERRYSPRHSFEYQPSSWILQRHSLFLSSTLWYCTLSITVKRTSCKNVFQ